MLTRALGVHHSLGDALAVEVSQLIDEGGVRQQERPTGSRGLRGQPLAHGGAMDQGQPLLVLQKITQGKSVRVMQSCDCVRAPRSTPSDRLPDPRQDRSRSRTQP